MLTDEFTDSVTVETDERRVESNLSLLRCVLLTQAIVQFSFWFWWSIPEDIPLSMRPSFQPFNIQAGFMLSVPYLFAVARSYGSRPVALAAAAGMASGVAGINFLFSLRTLLMAVIVQQFLLRNMVLALTEAAVLALSVRIAHQAGNHRKVLLWLGLTPVFMGVWYAFCVKFFFFSNMTRWN